MKFIILAAILNSMVMTSAHAEERRLIFSEAFYIPQANVSYTTGWKNLGPLQTTTNQVEITTMGRYCHLGISGLTYTYQAGGYPYLATPVGQNAIYRIDAGSLNSLKIDFFQQFYQGVDCTIQVHALVSGGGGDDQNDDLDVDAVRSDALYLDMASMLFALRIEDFSGYHSLIPLTDDFRDSIESLRDAIEDERAELELRRRFRTLRRAFLDLQSDFETVHSDVYNARVEDAWDDVASGFDDLEAKFYQ